MADVLDRPLPDQSSAVSEVDVAALCSNCNALEALLVNDSGQCHRSACLSLCWCH